jgi:hypothetical protein
MNHNVPKYTAVNAPLGMSDSRKAHVTGPDLNGRIRPVASFWSYAEAVSWAADRNKRQAMAIATVEASL